MPPSFALRTCQPEEFTIGSVAPSPIRSARIPRPLPSTIVASAPAPVIPALSVTVSPPLLCVSLKTPAGTSIVSRPACALLSSIAARSVQGGNLIRRGRSARVVGRRGARRGPAAAACPPAQRAARRERELDRHLGLAGAVAGIRVRRVGGRVDLELLAGRHGVRGRGEPEHPDDEGRRDGDVCGAAAAQGVVGEHGGPISGVDGVSSGTSRRPAPNYAAPRRGPPAGLRLQAPFSFAEHASPDADPRRGGRARGRGGGRAGPHGSRATTVERTRRRPRGARSARRAAAGRRACSTC